MNGYDFDKTIYDGDSYFHFYLFCLKRFPYLLLVLPFQAALMLFTFWARQYYKQAFSIFLLFVPSKEKQVLLFWKTHKKHIKEWYLAQKQPTDVIISASPVFLLKPICNELEVKNLIATQMNINNGIIVGRNCYGSQKVTAYKQVMGNKKLSTFYSDSTSDLPIMKLAEQAYFVNKNQITAWGNNTN